MEIRRMKEMDIEQVASLEASCFSDPWPLSQIEYELKENPCSVVLVAEGNKKIVGYIDFMITFDSATINRVCVLPSFRRKGIGFALLNEMKEICNEQKDEVAWITLEVRSSNEAAIRCYEKNGYERVTIKRHYYADGEDAIYMVRSILL